MNNPIIFINFFLFITLLLASCQAKEKIVNLDESQYSLMVEDVTNRVNTYSYGTYFDGLTKVIDRFTIVHFSDVHCNNNLWNENLLELIQFANQSLIRDRVQALINTGDLCNGMPGRNKDITIEEISKVNDILLSSYQPVFNVIGNHDSNIEEASKQNVLNSFTCALSKREQYGNIIKPFLSKSELRDSYIEGECYYHKDFNKYKIRLIVLDFIDYPILEDLEKKTFLKYTPGFIFSQNQLEWLYSTLFNTPLNYSIIIASHGPFTKDLEIGKYAQDVNLIPDIINSFKNGNIYVHKWNNSENKELSTNLVFDFSKRGRGDFICYLSGHIHNRVVTKTDKYNDQVIITSPQLFFPNPYSEGSYSYAKNVSFLDRNTSTIDKNSFNIISVDKSNRNLFLTCYGAYRDINGIFTDRTMKIKY